MMINKDIYKMIQIDCYKAAGDHEEKNYGKHIDKTVKAVTSKIQAAEKILDIGCGEGFTLTCFQKYLNSDYYGIELNPTKVGYAKAGNPNATIFTGDAHDLPMKDQFFDLVYCAHVLEHCLDIDAALSEAKRVLKDNGYFYVVIPFEPENTKPYGDPVRFNKTHTHPFSSEIQIKKEFGKYFKIESMKRIDLREPEYELWLTK